MMANAIPIAFFGVTASFRNMTPSRMGISTYKEVKGPKVLTSRPERDSYRSKVRNEYVRIKDIAYSII